MNKTGGGTLTRGELRIVESVLYADVVLKMGASATGNPARFDSDSTGLLPSPPTKRLSNAIFEPEDSRMSFESLPSSSHCRMDETVEINDEYDDSNGAAAHETPIKRCLSRSKSVSNSNDSVSTATGMKNIRDVRAQAHVQLSEFLSKNNENSELHNRLLKQQIEREEKAQNTKPKLKKQNLN